MTLLDKKFKGAALIMALFVTAIIASVSAGLFSMVSSNLENEKNMISEQQAILTTLSLESFTKKYLNNKENRNNIVLAENIEQYQLIYRYTNTKDKYDHLVQIFRHLSLKQSNKEMLLPVHITLTWYSKEMEIRQLL